MRNGESFERPEVDLFCVGTLFFDLVLAGMDAMPEAGAEVWAKERALSPGGVANRAVAAARLGLRTGLAGEVGTDMFGDHLWQVLHQVDNLDLRWTSRSPDVQTTLTVSVALDGDRRFLSHGEPTWPGEATLAPERLPRARAAQVGLEAGLPDWARHLRAEGTLLFGGVGWDPSGRWSTSVLDNLTQFDAFVCNTTEAMAYTRTDTPAGALRRLAERVPLAVVTDGHRGALAVDATSGELVTAPAVVSEAVDPTGAGDTFVAGFAYATLAGWPLRQRLLFANLCAGQSVRGLGGAVSAPTWDDLGAWFEATDRPTQGAAFGFLGPELARRRSTSPQQSSKKVC
ncbi:carbohydrate kinase family protein [Actinopolymorpha singaporensis]|uniref:Sugar or nucleoside kinase, ribokinase family n=1 Tax=Actinopolymorpha singaporensis TaxID=117157 RepID=A0A1H1WLJ9_9ACTN|nr:PfkB family carbohydrate kinase [Actinopolymorpha singaporensis]SDS98033.1 Sugar or nucleoside kinase, ribokinase family [Actinopolymorpha singaporensis]